MEKLTPQECIFDIGSEVNDGKLRIQLIIFPKDNNHPKQDRLDNDDFTDLPPYLTDLPMDAENLWDWDEGLFGPAPRPLEEIERDMVALGYTREKGIVF